MIRSRSASIRSVLALAATAALAACGAAEAPLTIRIASPAFADGFGISANYACDGENRAPALGWDHLPEQTQSLVLTVVDRAADGFTHWIVYDIPASTTGMREGGLPEGGVVGTNDFGKAEYAGPCPPAGSLHRYTWRLLALDTKLDLPAGASRKQVEEAMTGHVIARGETSGTYRR